MKNFPKINPAPTAGDMQKAWAECETLKDIKLENIEMTTDWSGWNIKTEDIKVNVE